MAYIVARILATPIKRLAREMVNVSDPFYRSKMISTRRDEIGLLERGFLSMMDRLRQAAIEKEQSQKVLIQTEKMAALGTLVAGLAHEINNPLSGAKNCLRRIESQPEDISQIKKYVSLMKNALTRIENLVRGLLQFSREKETVLHPVDINFVVSQAVELLEYQLKRREIKLDQSLTPNLPLIWGDTEQLEQVYINLIINAMDAMTNGGALSICSYASNGMVSTKIKDNGIGIPASELHKIFDPFYTTKDVGEGTGLGLSVCKNIIEAHNGTIEVESTVEVGTTFILSFPAIEESSLIKTGVCTAILAGGKSSRMGTNKALLKIDGETLIERMINIVNSCTEKLMIITNNPEEFSFLNVETFQDVIKGAGPLGGIYTALKHCQSTHCLVIACDLPFLSKELLQLLYKQGTAYDVLAVDGGKGVEPLCAVYSKNCIPIIEKQLIAGKHRVTDFYSSVNTKILYWEQNSRLFHNKMFFNINTPEDLKKAEKINKKLNV